MLDKLRILLENESILVLAGDVIPLVSPLSVTPPREEERGLYLGVDERERPVYINPENLPNMHGVILGTSGSGKSTLARHLIIEAHARGIRALVIDPHGEKAYARLFSRRLEVSRDKIDVLHAPGWDPIEYASELGKYIEQIYGLRGSRNVFREILRTCLEEGSLTPFERVSGEDPDLTRVYEDLARIHDSRGQQVEEFASSDVYVGFPLMVSRELAALAAQVLLLLVQGYRRMLGTSNRLQQLVVLEEAHVLTPYLLSLYKEVRKWGYSVLAVTQLARELDKRIFQLAGFVVVLSGPESFVRDVSMLFSLTEEERDHILYATRGAALLFRQGDPRARKVFLRVHGEALSA